MQFITFDPVHSQAPRDLQRVQVILWFDLLSWLVARDSRSCHAYVTGDRMRDLIVQLHMATL